jgi:methionine sulfoxide reductase catalytic subunit
VASERTADSFEAMLIKIPRGWELPERNATPESAYLNRRHLLKAAGFLGARTLLASTGGKDPYPARRNPEFVLDREITDEWAATSYNNFYEFNAENKQAVKDEVGKFVTSPWTIEIRGLVNKPQKLDVDTIIRSFPIEERLYRHRCVEAWAMAVPWTGFPLSELIKRVEPKSNAKFVRFVTVNRPSQMPGMVRDKKYPWPYFEALRIDEAMNPLCMLVTGIYGKPLPKQNGAAIRLVAPWKYGYKSAKSLDYIEFVEKQPATFWNQNQPKEYGFYSNVNPAKSYSAWSQAVEKVIPNMERRPTQPYNGYQKWVGALYNGAEY